MKLQSQIAVITGGASGMGLATAMHLIEQGVKVAIIDKAQSLNQNINASYFHCDVMNEIAITNALDEIEATLGTPRILVNCAGIAPASRMIGREGPMPLVDFQNVININLIGTFNMMRLCAARIAQLPILGEERGVIINTASIAAFEGQIGQTAYAASKAGIVGMTLPAARELSSLGIRVNTIAPGLIATPMLLNMPQEVQDSLASTVPFPKRFGRPEEYAALVQHLIENTMINGEVIRLDGALRMQPR